MLPQEVLEQQEKQEVLDHLVLLDLLDHLDGHMLLQDHLVLQGVLVLLDHLDKMVVLGFMFRDQRHLSG